MGSSRHASFVGNRNYDVIIPCQSAGDASVEELHPNVYTIHHRRRTWARLEMFTIVRNEEEHYEYEFVFEAAEP